LTTMLNHKSQLSIPPQGKINLTMPRYIFIAAAGEFESGLAIGLRFELKQKRSISFIVFMQFSPITFTGEYLFGELDRIGRLALMGATQPSEDFTGNIEAEALTEAEILGAIGNYHRYSASWNFPPNYLNDLEKALEINPKSNCIVGIECVDQI
jgi:hypothetical protein